MLTASDLRAELARHKIPIYKVAGLVNLHPVHLGHMLNGRTPFRSELAERVMQAVAQLIGAH